MAVAGASISLCPGRAAWLVVLLAVACTRDRSAGSPPPDARSTPRPELARTSATATPPDASPAPSTAKDASPTPDGAPPAACVFPLPTPAARLRAVGSAMLAKAIIPSLDSATMMAQASAGDGGPAQVTDCRGDRVDASWEDQSRPPGTVRIEARKAMPGGRDAVYLATAKALGMGQPEGYGLFAIVTLDGPRILVLGVSPWHPWRGWNSKLREEQLGEETVYVEPDGFENEIGGYHQENVWTLRGGELRVAGSYVTAQTRHPYGGEDVPDSSGFFAGESFAASPRFMGGKVLLEGESTWDRASPSDAGTSWAVGRRIPWERTFELRGGDLVETGPPSRWGHSLEERK